MSDRTQQQRMRVLRDDADHARANLQSSTARGLDNDERDRFIRRAHAHATLALAESFSQLTITLAGIADELGREWLINKTSRSQTAGASNGAGATGQGRKM